MSDRNQIPVFPKPVLVIDETPVGDALRTNLRQLRCRWDAGHLFEFPDDPEMTGEYELGLDGNVILVRDAHEGGLSNDRAWKPARGQVRCFTCSREGGHIVLYDLDREGMEVRSAG